MIITHRKRETAKFFGYLTLIDDFDEQIERYWDKNEKKIAPWYLAQKRPDDLIIRASPTCIIEPIAKRLGVNFMATEYDRESGVLLNNIMYAREKARYIIDKGFYEDRTFLLRFPGGYAACPVG